MFQMFRYLIVVKKYVRQWCIILIANILHLYLFPMFFSISNIQSHKNETIFLHYVIYDRVYTKTISDVKINKISCVMFC